MDPIPDQDVALHTGQHVTATGACDNYVMNDMNIHAVEHVKVNILTPIWIGLKPIMLQIELKYIVLCACFRVC